MAFTIRLDEETEKLITRLARQRRQTKAAVVREALAAYGAAQAAVERPKSAAAALAPFIGVADSGGSRRSEKHRHRFSRAHKRKTCPPSSLTPAPSSLYSIGVMPIIRNVFTQRRR